MRGPRLHEQLLVLHAGVEFGDERAVAVEQLGRDPLAGAEHALAGLAPARVRHLGIDVGPEAVLAQSPVLGIHTPVLGARVLGLGRAAAGHARLQVSIVLSHVPPPLTGPANPSSGAGLRERRGCAGTRN